MMEKDKMTLFENIATNVFIIAHQWEKAGRGLHFSLEAVDSDDRWTDGRRVGVTV